MIYPWLANQKRPEDPKQITIRDISIDPMTEVFATYCGYVSYITQENITNVTDEHGITFLIITLILSNANMYSRVKIVGQPNTTLSTSEAVQRALTAGTVQQSICYSCKNQVNSTPKPHSSNMYPADDTCTCRCTTIEWQEWCHASPIWSCQ